MHAMTAFFVALGLELRVKWEYERSHADFDGNRTG
jgi:hypothetical protein